MAIISYSKFIDSDITRELIRPEESEELATIEGVTYVYIPEGSVLSESQPEEIQNSISDAVLTDELKSQIKHESPHCKLISQRVIDKIRERYSIEDEQYFSRIGIGAALGLYEFLPGEEDLLRDFGVYVEGVRQWGRDQRALIGL